MQIPDIQYSTYIQAPPQRVYEVLTTADGWDAWFTQGTRVDAQLGGSIRLCWSDWGLDHVTAQDGGAVLEAVPGQKFVFQWQPGDTPTTVAIELEARGSGTVVHLTETGYTSMNGFVDCAVGWGEALTLLKFYLEHGVTYGKVP